MEELSMEQQNKCQGLAGRQKEGFNHLRQRKDLHRHGSGKDKFQFKEKSADQTQLPSDPVDIFELFF